MFSYKALMKNYKKRHIWKQAMCCESGRLAQEWNNKITGTNTFCFMTHDEIRNIPVDKTVTYGNLLHATGDLSAKSAGMTISNILWNSLLFEKQRGEPVYTSSEDKKFEHYLILKNVFQKYCSANISSTVRPIFNFRKSI